jgi:hypothetical protein
MELRATLITIPLVAQREEARSINHRGQPLLIIDHSTEKTEWSPILGV